MPLLSLLPTTRLTYVLFYHRLVHMLFVPFSSLARFHHDGSDCTIDGDATSGDNAFGCMWHSDHGGNTILAGDNGSMRHRSSRFHHQSSRLEEQRGPAGVR